MARTSFGRQDPDGFAVGHEAGGGSPHQRSISDGEPDTTHSQDHSLGGFTLRPGPSLDQPIRPRSRQHAFVRAHVCMGVWGFRGRVQLQAPGGVHFGTPMTRRCLHSGFATLALLG